MPVKIALNGFGRMSCLVSRPRASSTACSVNSMSSRWATSFPSATSPMKAL